MEKLKEKVIIILAELPILVLLAPKNKTGCMITGVIGITAFLFFQRAEQRRPAKFSRNKIAVLILTSILAGLLFYLRWYNTGRMKYAAGFLNLPAKQLCGLLGISLCFLACFSLNYLTGFIPIFPFQKINETKSDLLIVFLLAALTITLLSKCSPFYPFNDWVDPNTMFTLGRGMLKGYIPYRDLYEQKGPLLLGLHALSALISFDDFTGIWIVEIIACFLFLWAQYQMIKAYLGKRALAVLPIIALITYVPPAFVEGDCAEEICLPLLTIALFIGIKAIRENRLPSLKEGFFIGITSGCILWIKYSILGFYIGWFIFFLIFARKKKKISDLLSMLRGIILGVAVISVPIILYFVLNGAVEYLFNCYFVNNLRYYPVSGTGTNGFRLFNNWADGVKRMINANSVVSVLSLIGILRCFLRNKRQIGFFLLLTFVFGFLFIFISGVSFNYYTLIFGCFAVFGMLCITDYRLFPIMDNEAKTVICFFLCLGGLLIFSGNMYLLAYEKEDFPQYKVKEIIQNSGIDEPSLLHYRFLDDGFNLTSGLVPEQRFFCFFNLRLPEMSSEQDRYIEQAETDFVVTCHEPLYDSKRYKLIDSFPGDFKADGSASLFYLYQKTDEIRP